MAQRSRKDVQNLEIKTENVDGTEIQTYIQQFSHEESNVIEESDPIGLDNEMVEQEDDDDDEEGGSYFVDQSGNYYFQATKDSEPVLAMAADQQISQEAADNGMEVEDEEEIQHTATVVVQPKDSPKARQTYASQTISRTSNANRYTYTPKRKAATVSQTNEVITVVQSDQNSEQISYVLIVQDDNMEAAVGGDSNNETADQYIDQKPMMPAPLDSMSLKLPTATENAHACNYCSYSTSKRYLLSRHMKSHSEDRPHKCTVCERGFKTVASLQNHVNTHTGLKPHHCKFCESTFTTSGELVRHVRYKHTHEKPHKCPECDYASVELSKLKRHIRCHTGERPYQCPHCTYASPDTFKLKRHLRIHTGEKPYECDICHARFTQSNSLKAHKLIHSVGDKPVFHCELCPTTCGRKTDLRIHVQKLHTSDQPIKCRRCGKSYPDRYTYKIHAKTHEGEKCFKCDLCPYASISARHLESHILIHTDQKPYPCDHCEQSFRQRQLLRRHINLHHNPEYKAPAPNEKTHKCPSCSRVFRHKGNLIRHMAVHDPDSGVKEEQKALKAGRKRRVRIVDGKEVYEDLDIKDENYDEDYEDEEENEDDGQQYVVLEVIQMPDGQQQEKLVQSDLDEEQEEEEEEEIEETEEIGLEHGEIEMLADGQDDSYLVEEDSEAILMALDRQQPEKMLNEKNMGNCFGFDDDDDDDLNSDQEKEHKASIKLLQ